MKNPRTEPSPEANQQLIRASAQPLQHLCHWHLGTPRAVGADLAGKGQLLAIEGHGCGAVTGSADAIADLYFAARQLTLDL